MNVVPSEIEPVSKFSSPKCYVVKSKIFGCVHYYISYIELITDLVHIIYAYSYMNVVTTCVKLFIYDTVDIILKLFSSN